MLFNKNCKNRKEEEAKRVPIAMDELDGIKTLYVVNRYTVAARFVYSNEDGSYAGGETFAEEVSEDSNRPWHSVESFGLKDVTKFNAGSLYSVTADGNSQVVFRVYKDFHETVVVAFIASGSPKEACEGLKKMCISRMVVLGMKYDKKN